MMTIFKSTTQYGSISNYHEMIQDNGTIIYLIWAGNWNRDYIYAYKFEFADNLKQLEKEKIFIFNRIK